MTWNAVTGSELNISGSSTPVLMVVRIVRTLSTLVPYLLRTKVFSENLFIVELSVQSLLDFFSLLNSRRIHYNTLQNVHGWVASCMCFLLKIGASVPPKKITDKII
jgi:hypothetical protein